jgi:hypothetical protein
MSSHARALHTENRITIDASSAAVFALAADVARWPRILTHYRYVNLLFFREPGDVLRRVAMGAHRFRIPVSWTSIQLLDPAGCRVSYRHIGGVTRGMVVEWRISPGPHGCAVLIVHDLPAPHGLLRWGFARRVAAAIFIRAIADRTLRGIKQAAESHMPRSSAS